jgi:hypothetical protein
LRAVIEFVSLVNNVCLPDAVILPEFEDLLYVCFLVVTLKWKAIVDFESFFANARNKCSYTKAACFVSQVGYFFVGVPDLAPLLPFFGEISRLQL